MELTSRDVADMLGRELSSVINARSRLGIKCKTVKSGMFTKCIWSEDDFKKIKEWSDNLRAKDRERENKKQQDIEELKKLHPLVTDERCFNMEWWPDEIQK